MQPPSTRLRALRGATALLHEGQYGLPDGGQASLDLRSHTVLIVDEVAVACAGSTVAPRFGLRVDCVGDACDTLLTVDRSDQ